jgi:hypothetical protein
MDSHNTDMSGSVQPEANLQQQQHQNNQLDSNQSNSSIHSATASGGLSMIANSTYSQPQTSQTAQPSISLKPQSNRASDGKINSHKTPNVRSLKRTTSTFDDESDDENAMQESKESDLPYHNHKRPHLANQTETNETSSNAKTHTSSSTANVASTSGGDESFYDLLSHFASLDLPSADEKSHTEPCPICAMPFDLTTYARHVYQCIQADEDLRYAQEICESDLYDQELNAVVMRSIMTQDQHTRQQELKRLLKLKGSSYSSSSPSKSTDLHDSMKTESPEDVFVPGERESATDLVDDAIARVQVKRHTSEGQTSEGLEPHEQVEGKVDFDEEQDEDENYAHAIAKSLQGHVRPKSRLAELAQQTVLEKVKSHTLNVAACVDGSSCKRTDAQHFLLKIHPEVSCQFYFIW